MRGIKMKTCPKFSFHDIFNITVNTSIRIPSADDAT
jgi:hypothetical protein